MSLPNKSQSQRLLEAVSGRIRLQMRTEWSGKDLLVTLTGGDIHIGAVALADKTGVKTLQRQNHREGEIVADLASTLANVFGCGVVVVCGIHYDNINKEEIAEVLRLATELRDDLIKLEQNG